MINIACVQVGNYLGRGAEYVNILYDMVMRNIDEGTPGRFVCFTDDPTGLHPNIEARLIPDLPGWWAKLYLFSPDAFPKGERVLYFDLDTLIAGPISDLLSYDGKFAILEDFYRRLERGKT